MSRKTDMRQNGKVEIIKILIKIFVCFFVEYVKDV